MARASDEQRALVIKALDSDAWDDGEKKVLRWQWGLLGSFWTALFRALELADDTNLAALAEGFPSTVNAFRAWKEGDLAPRMRATGIMD